MVPLSPAPHRKLSSGLRHRSDLSLRWHLGVDPDAGSGGLELAILGGLLLVTIATFAAGVRDRRRSAAAFSAR